MGMILQAMVQTILEIIFKILAEQVEKILKKRKKNNSFKEPLATINKITKKQISNPRTV